MGNTTRFESGRNAVVEEVRVLAPDTHEAIDRLEAIQRAIEADHQRLVKLMSEARIVLGSLNVNIKQLTDELRGDRLEVNRRLRAISDGAERLGYAFLTQPAIRVVAGEPDPEDIA